MFTVIVMVLVIAWAIKAIVKELDLGDIIKERSKSRIRERMDDD